VCLPQLGWQRSVKGRSLQWKRAMETINLAVGLSIRSPFQAGVTWDVLDRDGHQRISGSGLARLSAGVAGYPRLDAHWNFLIVGRANWMSPGSEDRRRTMLGQLSVSGAGPVTVTREP
jgi:hypothetical protein